MNSCLRRPAVALIATTLAASVLGIAPAAHAADGTLTGTVTGSGSSLSGAEVTVYEYNDIDMYWEPIEYLETNAEGDYSVVLPEGSYRVGFDDNYFDHISEFHVDAAEVRDADTVVVPGAGDVVVDADLAPGAHVTGTVTGPGSTNLQGILVTAYQAVEEDGEVWYDEAGSDYTAANGNYDVGGLRTGNYKLEFSDPAYNFDRVTTYATEWYDDVTTAAAASDVAATAPQTTPDIDAELTLDAEMSGTLTDANGTGIEGRVIALAKVGDTWEDAVSTWANEDGTYVLEGLRAGTYRVQMYGWVGERFDYAFDFWNNKGRVENADDVVVTVGAPRTGIDAELVASEHYTDITVLNTSLPTISGSPVVGQTLTASPGTWSPTPTEYYYDWLRDGEFIVGEYGPTYTPTAADVGKRITVLVAAGAPDYDYGSAESAPTAPVTAPAPAPAPAATPAPVVAPVPVISAPAALAAILKGVDVAGKPKVGTTLKISGLDKLFRASTPVSYKFQWFAGKKAIKKATKSKLKVTKAMKGKKLSVKVTAKAGSATKSVKLKVGKVR